MINKTENGGDYNMYNRVYMKFMCLILVFSLNPLILNSKIGFAEVSCSQLNTDGQIADVNCAIDFAEDQLKTNKPYMKMENIGQNSEYTLYFFAPTEVSKIISNLSIPVDYDIFIEKNRIGSTNEISEKISNWGDEISKGLVTAGAIVAGGGLLANQNIDGVLNLQFQRINNNLRNLLNVREPNREVHAEGVLTNLLISVPFFLGAGLTKIVSGVLAYTINPIEKQRMLNVFTDKLKSYNIERRNYFSVLRKIYDQIIVGAFTVNKFLCLKLNSDKDDYGADVLLLHNENAATTEVDENKFNQEIEVLKNDIEKILKENDN